MSRGAWVAVCALLVFAPSGARAETLKAADVDDVSVRGINAVAAAFVPIPPGYAVDGGTVDLRFEHSPLVRPDVSTVTLAAGGTPLGSARLTRESATGGRLRAELPSLPDARRGLVLEARFFLRITRDDCEDPQNAALWARMLDTTTVEPRLVPADRTLAAALDLLQPPRPGAPLDVALPATPTAAQVAAAGRAVAGAARANVAAAASPFVRVVDAPSTTATTLVVGPAGAVTPGLSVSEDGAPRVRLAGDDAALRRAADALVQPRLNPASGSATAGGDGPGPPDEARPWRRSAASFAQLGIEPREVTGDAESTIEMAIDRPPHWKITEDAELELHMASGGGVGEGSAVSVAVNGRELGSRRLERDSDLQRLRFDLPRGLVDTDLDGAAVRMLRLTIRPDLDTDRRPCRPEDVDGVRATLLDTSKITLPHETTGEADLSRFPAPMDGPVRVVLPDRPTRDQIAAGLQVASALGRFSEPSEALPELTTAGALGERRDADLILLGDADRQVGERIDAPGGVTGGAGSLVLRESPWNDGRHVLALDGDLMKAARALASRSTVERLVGTAVVVRATTDPEAVAATKGEPPLLLAPVRDESLADRIPVWAIPSAVVLVALLVIGGLVVRRRWLRR